MNSEVNTVDGGSTCNSVIDGPCKQSLLGSLSLTQRKLVSSLSGTLLTSSLFTLCLDYFILRCLLLLQ
jgi:hypothetical protein